VSTIDKVREFHEAFGVPCAESPTPITAEIRVLRVKLIAEELCELCRALGVNLIIEDGEFHVSAYAADEDVDLVETADALGDLDYVVQGANLAFGIPASAVMDEIHRANMSKLGDDGKPVLREDGKITKGPKYTPPDIAKVLREKCR
jgi:predicted HAD superfamily Cof-like phosphohydrolase